MILIVEDDRDTQAILEKLLTHYNYPFHITSSSKEALAYCQENTPKLLLVDISLPDMNGFELTKELRKIDKMKKCPIVVMSVNVAELFKEKGIESGATDYLEKPLTPSTLKSLAEKYIP